MEPVLDPPPLPDQLTAAVPDAATANPVAAQTYAHKHPPYAEMITAAISALMEPNGSSKRAIAKYIGDHYSDLPSTHEALLTHHLKRLKINGQLLMVKHSYKLPRSAPPPPNGAVNAVAPHPSPAGPKKRPGRPPKHKPEAAQRGRGRPPKAGGVAKTARDLSALRPRKLSGKPVGRPRKNASGGAVNRGVDSQLLLAYLDLKAKLENLHSRISQTANTIKPYLNNEASINALQELELIAANMIVPHPSIQPPPQPQVQPQPQPPLLPEQYPQQPQN
ncbi:winged-helix DNA-binding transcription factor family protein [Striga hermonthica]|uniref:Winged-helix DNA-binding transcription factor family protein n=1 Tax=Striga hermonthica TaxID=68872 RepID=A0A9N7NDR3_STRHE|nr:winged-helix DNA-binding transcription factor family protein [Striga hermonthica]